MNEMPTSTPIDIGARLRQARLKHGQSLDVVHQHTRIPKKFLEAMENNRFDEFPALVYLRGFLKSYCEHLDLEFEPLWNQISPQKPQTDGTAEAASSKTEPRTDRPSAPAPREHEEESHTPRFTPPTSLLPLFAFLLVVGAIGLLMLHKSKPAPVVPPPSPPPAAIAPIRPKEKMALKVRFHKETWVRLHCDGVLRFEGRAPAGFSQEWSAMNDFTLRVKSPEDIDLTLDGKEVKLTASPQEPSGDYKITRQ